MVLLPANAKGKLDVGGRCRTWYSLSVIKDLGMKEPYVGQTELQTGEIAEDLTYYFATSEQVPSCVGLGVLMKKDNTVRQAGGFIIQLMPFTDEKVIDSSGSRRLHRCDSVTAMLDDGMTPGADSGRICWEILVWRLTIPFRCPVSLQLLQENGCQRPSSALGAKELQSMIR